LSKEVEENLIYKNKNYMKKLTDAEKEISKELKKQKKKEYYLKNKEKYLKRQNEYNKKNKEDILLKKKEYHEKNKDSISIKKKKYREDNKEILTLKKKVYYSDNKEDILNKKKEYYFSLNEEQKEINRELRRKRDKERRINDIFFKLKTNMRSLIGNSFYRNGYKKESKTFDIIGCSFEDFKNHIEKQFTEWMSWENYGNPVDGLIEPNKNWEIDHIMPLSSAINEVDILKLNHYTNLQPLCIYENRWIKRDN